MGERGPGAYKIWLNHCSSEYADMIDGPASRTNEKIKEVRRHWRDGGRELVMRNWKVPGVRPFGFLVLRHPGARSAQGDEDLRDRG